MTVENPTLHDLDLHSARRITHHRYVRHDDETPEGWTDDGPCPGHHSRWSRSVSKIDMDAVNHPAHYKQGEVEVIDIIEQIVAGYEDPRVAYLIGSALKYLSRAPHKGNQQQDLQKAEWFLRRAINKSVATPTRDAPRGGSQTIPARDKQIAAMSHKQNTTVSYGALCLNYGTSR